MGAGPAVVKGTPDQHRSAAAVAMVTASRPVPTQEARPGPRWQTTPLRAAICCMVPCGRDSKRLNRRCKLISTSMAFPRTGSASSADPTWSIGQSVCLESCRRFVNACSCPMHDPGIATERRVLFSGTASASRSPPAKPGTVYMMLLGQSFKRKPGHEHPSLGAITGCQFAGLAGVLAVAGKPVGAANSAIDRRGSGWIHLDRLARATNRQLG